MTVPYRSRSFGYCPLVLRLVGVGGEAPSCWPAHGRSFHPVDHVARTECIDCVANGTAKAACRGPVEQEAGYAILNGVSKPSGIACDWQ
jgi:hypothetical protein